jgi:ATP-binding cassette, subfamily G (WHITE), member 2, SNQ2
LASNGISFASLKLILKSELFVALQGRGVVMRHKDLAFYRPSAVVIARTILDIPLVLLQTAIFSLIVYFLGQLTRTAGQFFIYYVFVFLSVYSMTQCYRMFAAWLGTFDDALRFVGLAILIMFFYVGYTISKVRLIADAPWFGWLYCFPFLVLG